LDFYFTGFITKVDNALNLHKNIIIAFFERKSEKHAAENILQFLQRWISLHYMMHVHAIGFAENLKLL
jgi:hypothetical protein